jgi:hypothetical protein
MRFGILFVLGLVAAAAGPLQLTVIQGEGAIHNIHARQFVEPVVRVTDNGEPVAGAIVSFLLPQAGPGGRFPHGPMLTLATAPDGTAAARGFQPNAVTGQFEIRVTASWNGQHARATLLQTNAAPAEARAARPRSRTFLILGLIAGGAAAGAVAALGGGSSPSPAAGSAPPPAVVQPPATIAAGSGSLGAPSP